MTAPGMQIAASDRRLLCHRNGRLVLQQQDRFSKEAGQALWSPGGPAGTGAQASRWNHDQLVHLLPPARGNSAAGGRIAAKDLLSQDGRLETTTGAAFQCVTDAERTSRRRLNNGARDETQFFTAPFAGELDAWPSRQGDEELGSA